MKDGYLERSRNVKLSVGVGEWVCALILTDVHGGKLQGNV